ncbi:hypothetical protein [Curtobacterium sp. Leaf261]|uniref:hypothetical protein n=1 Tax=Curtobacterium sp. Leaf261 TaxID=1736311 RepID=UPI0006F2EF13|nr:hypothetical protein [Curtobacterium sp. Leaf261]KQO64850.1 hypothetical protein ASF23_01295 [Curtobacterium sp. Leaf261]
MRSGLEEPHSSAPHARPIGGGVPDGLPAEELQAAVLDGELFRVGDMFASIAVADDAVLRARGFLTTLAHLGYAPRGLDLGQELEPTRGPATGQAAGQATGQATGPPAWPAAPLVAERLSAAWIWGATSRPPVLHTACAPAGARRRGPFSGVVVRETRLGPDDVIVLGDRDGADHGVGVTSPVRTALDLLRDRSGFGAVEHAAVRGLLDGSVQPSAGAGGHDGGVVGGDVLAVRRSLEATTGLPYGRQALRRLAAVVASLGP